MARDPEITPDLLLAHAGFVRSLARQLLADEALVEDVVQETWVRALQEGPRKKEALTAWLRAVTRNLAFKAMRTSRRRKRREHVAARGEGLPSTADLVTREHSLKSVVDSVLSLPEHYRQVVMLRYFEDMPPRKIAVQLDLPVNTVRMRLHRALKQLRGSLDREYGTPGAWCQGVALLAGLPPKHAPAVESSVSPALGAVLLLGTLAVGGVALFAWTHRADGLQSTTAMAPDAGEPELEAVASGASGVAPTNPAEREALAPIEDKSAEEAVRATDSRESASAVVLASGVVVDAGGRAVPGAVVYGEWGKDGMLVRGRTDADGRFTVEVPFARAREARDGGYPFLFGARARSFAPSTVIPWHGDPAQESVIVVRTGGAALRGTVRDPSGAPVAGAEVRVGESYRLGLAFLGAQVLTDDGGPGRLMSSQLVDATRPAIVRRVKFARGYLGPQTLGAAGEIGRLLPPLVARTDEDGAWRAEGLEPGKQPIRVRVTGYAPRVLATELRPGEERTLDVALEHGARLVGQARRDDGLPLGRSLVYVVGDESGVRRSTRLNDEGRFTLVDLPAGRVRVFAESKTARRTTHSATTELVLGAGEEATWDALLTRQETVLGTLLGPGERPLVGWRVQIRLDQNPSRAVVETTTDESGHFELEACPPFPASLYVYHPGDRQVHPSRVVHDLESSPERRVLRLTANEVQAGSIAARVRDPRGEPVPENTSVLLVPEGSRHLYDMWTGAGGTLRSQGMPSGRYALVVPDHGLGWIRPGVIELAPGEPHELGDVRLPELGRLRIGAGAFESDALHLRLTAVGPDALRLVLFEGRAMLPLDVAVASGRYVLERLDGDAEIAPVELVVRPGETVRPRAAVLR